jgi:hypothetical protein
MRFLRHYAPASNVSLHWALAVLLLAMSVLGSVAASHAPVHDDPAFAVAALSSDSPAGCDEETPHPPGLASLSHDLAHAWHHCGVVMAVLPTPVVKLIALPPMLPPSVASILAPTPALQGLFRPPIR